MGMQDFFEDVEDSPWYVRWGVALLIALFIDSFYD